MKIEHFEVRSEFLRKYIDYYYFLSTIGDSESTTYLTFPTCGTPLGFIKNAATEISSNKIRVEFSSQSALKTYLPGNYLKPLQITFEPDITELSIVFKPLGINFFNARMLGKTLSENISLTGEFAGLLPYVELIIDGEDAFDELETRLISDFKSNRQLEILESIISSFQDAENAASEQQLAAELKISPKTLFRLFKNHLGLNPTQYRRLLRFRNAVDLSLKNCRIQNLTEAGLIAGYYDQPHFIKEFKKITDLSPRVFFDKISLEANDKIVWQFFSEMSDSYN